MKKLGPLVRVVAAEPLSAFHVRLSFADSNSKDVDLEPYLHGPLFEPLRQDRALFSDIRIQGGTICWANGADIDPDVLYYGLKPAWMDESEPS